MAVPDSINNWFGIGIINLSPVDLVTKIPVAYLPGLANGSVAPVASRKHINDGIGNLSRLVSLP